MVIKFIKKMISKIKVYYYYFIEPKSRNFFFILIYRKLLNIFRNKKKLKETKNIIEKWCDKKKILEKNFYIKIGIKKPKDFFQNYNSFYLSAKLKQKNLNYKMGGMANLNLIYNIIEHQKPKKILETGVAFGWSTLAIILSKSFGSKLTSIDLSYPTKSSEKFVGMAIPSNLKKKFNLLRDVDYKCLVDFYLKKKKFDLVHYDSDKSYLGKIKNYDLIWKILNKRGCFISDDISDNSAFYDFIKKKKINFFYILKFKNKHIGIVYK